MCALVGVGTGAGVEIALFLPCVCLVTERRVLLGVMGNMAFSVLCALNPGIPWQEGPPSQVNSLTA